MEIKENKLHLKVVLTSLSFLFVCYFLGVCIKDKNHEDNRGPRRYKYLGSFFGAAKETVRVEATCPAQDY